MKNPKNLTLKQKKFLESQGLNADEFLIIAAPVDYYKFYHVLSGKEVVIRRWYVKYVDKFQIHGAIVQELGWYVISAALTVSI